ncbi:MAG: aquaporin, partial [Actinomycetota bacterium]
MRKYAAEFIAAFFLVFAGVSAIIADQHLGVVLVRQPLGILGIALAHGLALAAAIAAVARISGGHANPAVSIAFFVARRISGKDLAGYVAGQFAGGIAAAFLAKLIYPAAAVAQTKVGAPGLGDQVRAG